MSFFTKSPPCYYNRRCLPTAFCIEMWRRQNVFIYLCSRPLSLGLIAVGWNWCWMEGQAATGRRNVLGGLIWKHQTAVRGSGMSGGERGRRHGCNAQTYTQVHAFKWTHTWQSSWNRQHPSFSCLCNFTLFPPISHCFLLSSSTYCPVSISANFGWNKSNNGTDTEIAAFKA